MPLFCPLASGSKGNAIYLESENTRLLIDAGLTYKQIKMRLAMIGVGIEDLDGVIITHEHTDHIRGLDRLSTMHNLPVLVNRDTAKAIYEMAKVEHNYQIFSTGETFVFGDIEVHPFSVQHDTMDPVAFTFSFSGVKVGHCADLGFVTSLVKNHLKECDYLYIEANHEPHMVHASARPPVYKQRVLSRQGHISNAECAELVKEIYHKGLKHVYLAHLSEECNNPELALKKVRAVLPNTVGLSIALQEKPTLGIKWDSTMNYS